MVFGFVTFNGLWLVLGIVPDPKQGGNEREQKHAHGTKSAGPRLGGVFDARNEEGLCLN